MPTITLTEKAESDLEAIHEYYAQSAGQSAATAIIVEMLGALEPLRTFSGLGRPSQAPNVRELVFVHYPFVAPYRVRDDQVQILRVLHQRTHRA